MIRCIFCKDWFETVHALKCHSEFCEKHPAVQRANELEKLIIYGFYEEEHPIYSQGPATNELQIPATAKELEYLTEVVRMATPIVKTVAEGKLTYHIIEAAKAIENKVQKAIEGEF